MIVYNWEGQSCICKLLGSDKVTTLFVINSLKYGGLNLTNLKPKLNQRKQIKIKTQIKSAHAVSVQQNLNRLSLAGKTPLSA